MKKLNEENKKEVIEYLMREPEMNLFALGDIETLGIDSEKVSAYTSENWGNGIMPYFILDYLGDYLIYSHSENYNSQEVADFLRIKNARFVNGKQEIIAKLSSHFRVTSVTDTYMARLNFNSIKQLEEHTLIIRRLKDSDLKDIYLLYMQIEEFKNYYFDGGKEDAIKKISTDLNGNGRIYGLFADNVLVSVARTTAETKHYAMVVGVSTIPEYRNRGYATYVVSKLCRDCLEEGMRFLCLFYNNPSAGKIYNQIGFEELGIFSMMRIDEV